MVVTVLRIDPIEVEVQAVGIGPRNGRCPTVPVVTDVRQHTGTAVAEARGRCRSTLELGLSGEKNALSPRASEIFSNAALLRLNDFAL